MTKIKTIEGTVQNINQKIENYCNAHPTGKLISIKKYEYNNCLFADIVYIPDYYGWCGGSD
jgi:hypothetical protein